jgi:hypothetical protein
MESHLELRVLIARTSTPLAGDVGADVRKL